ncbi:MAG: hypothetical protein MK105_19680 [Crocinitomicaceae bacterium]|nr:hypothetical protein [Crocinitomicaceae bacterium]
MLNSLFCFAQNWEDSSYVPIWLEVYLEQEKSSFDKCDGLPTLFIYEDDSLVYRTKFESISDTISLVYSKDLVFNITHNHIYNLEIVFEDRRDKKILDNFSTNEVNTPTKFVRAISLLGCYVMLENDYYFRDTEMLPGDECEFVRTMSFYKEYTDSIYFDIMYNYVKKDSSFEKRVDYIESLVISCGFDENQFGFTFGQSGKLEDYFRVEVLHY